MLLYDLTNTYSECDVPDHESDPRRFGYSRAKRGDCVQVIVALVVTPEGLPLAYEMLPGNTADKTTLHDMLKRIQDRYAVAKLNKDSHANRSEMPSGTRHVLFALLLLTALSIRFWALCHRMGATPLALALTIRSRVPQWSRSTTRGFGDSW